MNRDPVKLILKERGKWKLTSEARSLISQLEGPLSVIGIMGEFRSGKSLILNQLAGITPPQKGFALGHSEKGVTRDVWVWTDPSRREIEGSSTLYLDFEGLFDSTGRTEEEEDDREEEEEEEEEPSPWTKDQELFTLSLLLTSHLLINTKGAIGTNHLEALHQAAQMVKRVVMSKGEGAREGEGEDLITNSFRLCSLFPSLTWLARDFFYEQKFSDDEILEEALKTNLEKKKRRNSATALVEMSKLEEMKLTLKASFPLRSCVTFPLPVQPNQLTKIESLPRNQRNSQFDKKLQILSLKVKAPFENNSNSPNKNSNSNSNNNNNNNKRPVMMARGGFSKGAVDMEMNGELYLLYIEQYLRALNSRKPLCLEDIWEEVSKRKCKEAVRKAHEAYSELMNHEQTRFPLSLQELADLHHQANDTSSEVYAAVAQVASQLLREEYISDDLFPKIEHTYALLKVENYDRSKRKCLEILTSFQKKIEDERKQFPPSWKHAAHSYLLEAQSLMEKEGPAAIEIYSLLVDYVFNFSTNPNTETEEEKVEWERKKREEEEKEAEIEASRTKKDSLKREENLSHSLIRTEAKRRVQSKETQEKEARVYSEIESLVNPTSAVGNSLAKAKLLKLEEAEKSRGFMKSMIEACLGLAVGVSLYLLSKACAKALK